MTNLEVMDVATLWEETFFGMDTARLKQEAVRLHLELEHASGWLRRRKLRKQLMQVLDEIEYQEGRKQYANRPFTLPSARISGGGMNGARGMRAQVCSLGNGTTSRKETIMGNGFGTVLETN